MSDEATPTEESLVKDEEPKRHKKVGRTVALMLVAFVAGALLGYQYLGDALERLFGGELVAGRVSVSVEELDDVTATYTVGGQVHEITFRDALLEHGSLEAARRADGSYRVPSADSVLAVARSQVMCAEAERLGIVVGDDEVAAYALATFGTEELSDIALVYGMDRDAAAVLLREAAMMSALRDQALVNEAGEPPAPPSEPGEAEEVTMTEAYAAYILELAGDEWDSEAGAWVSADGPFASALADYEVTPEGATYEAARQAYYVAYQRHVTKLSDYASQWTDYVNRLLGDASITISTLAL